MAFKKKSFFGKYKYHYGRDCNPKAYGIRYGSNKHAYSSGFSDGVEKRILDDVPNSFKKAGKKAAWSYKIGRARGLKWREKAIKEYGTIQF